MSGSDLSAWRRQNSDPVLVEIVLADGTEIKGSLMKPRDKNLRETISTPDPFIEIESNDDGMMLLSKAQLRFVRPIEMARADQMELRLRQLEKLDVYGVLRIKKDADLPTVEAAAAALRTIYDPERCRANDLPPEIGEYLAAVRKRIDTAEAEIVKLLTPRPVRALPPSAVRRPAA